MTAATTRLGLRENAGQFALLQNPAAYCLLFDEDADDEQYLFGVQSTAPNAATVASVLVASDADDGVASPSASLPTLPGATAPSSGEGLIPTRLNPRPGVRRSREGL